MNPPDDNQPGSKRQPIMSAKRRAAAGDDSILARLERDARRGRPGMRWKQSWIVWCSVASLVIIGLIGFLASLARENLERHAPKAAADIKVAPDPYAPPAAGVANGFAPLPASATPAKQPVAADMHTDRTVLKTDAAAARPPLVMLKPNATPAKPAAAQPPSRIAAARPVAGKAVAPRPPATAARKTTAATATRSRKPAQVPAAAPEPADDSDVALLSAILLQASRHADERAQLEAARCGAGKKCAPAPDPLQSSKATD